jgi:hypothetical protein
VKDRQSGAFVAARPSHSAENSMHLFTGKSQNSQDGGGPIVTVGHAALIESESQSDT